ncbi:MAG: uroporphyrinogen decarboxylase [Chlamydiota bacterium]
MNDLFLKALRCEPVPRPPVWLMRQAGRYMPQYRALRAQHSLWEMFHSPELAARVTLLPIELLGVDAAIVFSDILVVAEMLGLSVQFPEKGGPRVEPAIHTAQQVFSLQRFPAEKALGYVLETLRRVKQQIEVPLIGFCGGPFTVASYFIDSTSQTAFERTKRWMREDPKSLHALLQMITDASIEYLLAQVRAGADVLQIFDSWASVLEGEEFEEYSLHYLQQMVDALRGTGVPVILFCRDSSLRAEPLSKIAPACISFDWHAPMADLRKVVPQSIAIQGNCNPEELKRPPEEIEFEVKALLRSMEGARGFIVNLGHGVTPDIPLEHVQCFVNAVKGK